jgi:hypothetical protein
MTIEYSQIANRGTVELETACVSCYVIYAYSRIKSTNDFETPRKVFDKPTPLPDLPLFKHLRSLNRIKLMLFTLTPLNARIRAVKFYTRRRLCF